MNNAAPAELHVQDFRFVETREEITIIFGAGRFTNETGAELVIDTSCQVILTPSAAKRFAFLLKDMVTRHEAAYGVIGNAPAEHAPAAPGAERRLPPAERSSTKSGERLRQLVDGLDVEYGLEYSFKIFSGVILDDRFLIAINRKAIPGNATDKLLSLCRRLNMPPRFERIYSENLADANIVLFGYEGNEASGTYKVYLEFGSMFDTVVREPSGTPVSFLIHLGFKWDAEDNRRAALTRYTCYPTFSVDQILGRLQERFYAGGNSATYEVIRGIVERADRAKQPDVDFLYVEVREENNPRQSYDVNLYRANLTMEDLYPWLREACRVQGIDPDAFHRVYEPMKKKIFGHVSGGVDRSGRDFLTFYYGLKGSTK